MKKEIFYTIQRKAAWEKAKRLGYLQSEKEYEMFPDAYEWMKDQMEDRIWGYSRSEGIIWMDKEKNQAELRNKIANEREEYVLLKIKCDNNKVLGSLFYPWNTIVTFYDMHGHIKEGDFYRLYGISTDEIFDIKNGEETYGIQYTTGRVNIDSIKRIL